MSTRFSRNTLILAIAAPVTAVVIGYVIPAYFKRPSIPVPEIFGTVAPGFEEVKEVFRKNYEDGWDHREAGSAFCVYYEGRKVVDLWAGYADIEAKRQWKEDTLTVIYSTTKGLGALCIAMLVDRGLLDFKKPVADYWPEFAQKGKGNITVEQLMEHEAGLYATNEPMTLDLLRDPIARDKVLVEIEPAWEPGTTHGYHGATIGLYVDALVRRVDPKKRTVGQFFAEEVREQFDVDAYIGLPPELFYRAARCNIVKGTLYHTLYAIINVPFIRKSFLRSITGRNKYIRNLLTKTGEVFELHRLCNPDILKLEQASMYGVASARGVAKVFGILANGGKDGNKTLLSKEIIDEYANDNRGLTPDIVMFDEKLRWKYGMSLIPQKENEGNLYGSSGYGGQMGFADPNNKIGYGFVSRYASPMAFKLNDPRFFHLKDSVIRAVNGQRQ